MAHRRLLSAADLLFPAARLEAPSSRSRSSKVPVQMPVQLSGKSEKLGLLLLKDARGYLLLEKEGKPQQGQKDAYKEQG